MPALEKKGFSNIGRGPLHEFEGREKQLQLIRENFFKNSRCVITQAISGTGGIGKTFLAKKFSIENFEDYKGMIWFVSSESADSIIASLRSLLINFGYNEKDVVSMNDQNILNKVFHELNKTPRMLLIFDNVDDIEEEEFVRDYIDKIPIHHHVLITSRRNNWKAYGPLPIPLNLFTEDEAVKYILKILNEHYKCNETSTSARRLAIKLGNLPLALSQAVHTIGNSSTIEKYLEEYEKSIAHKKALLNKKVFSEDFYKWVVYNTWDISRKILQAKSPSALQILNICAYLSPDQIPMELFKNQQDVKELANLSLVEITDVLEGDRSSIGIHCLLQEVLLIKISEEEKINQSQYIADAVRCINYAFKYDWNEPVAVDSRLRPLFLHIDSISTHCISNNIFNLELVELLYKAGSYYLHYLVILEEAEKYLNLAQKVCDQISNNISNKSDLEKVELLRMKIRNHMAKLFHSKKDYRNAEKYCNEIIESTFFDTDMYKKEKAFAYAVLGHIKHEKGELSNSTHEFKLSEENYQKSLNIYERMGLFDDQYYRVKNRKGCAILAQPGREQEAIDIFNDILDNYWKLQSNYNNNFYAARTVISLAKAYYKAAKDQSNTDKFRLLEQAREQILEAIQILDSAYGDYTKIYPLHSVEARDLAGDIFFDLEKYSVSKAYTEQAGIGWGKNGKEDKRKICEDKLLIIDSKIKQTNITIGATGLIVVSGLYYFCKGSAGDVADSVSRFFKK